MGRAVAVLAVLAGCGPQPATVSTRACRAQAQPIVEPRPSVIRPSTQVVRVAWTADASDAVEAMGLAAVEDRILTAVQMHVAAAWSDYDVVFVVDDAQADPAQVLTIDVVGADPNGRGLLESATSAEKDVGNSIRDEHFGPYTASLADAGRPAYGGLFVGELFAPATMDAWPEAADCFDDVVPALGGEPLTPDDANEAEADRIASLVGALLADALVHLTGHAVGLTATDPQRWHNVGDNGCFMDNGGSRDYAERAGLRGEGSEWCPENAAYLSSILPLP